MYRPAKHTGDSVQVPQLLFARLCAPGADDARFRVALYVLGKGAADVKDIADELRLDRLQVQAALHYWEGAGLLENDEPQKAAPPPPEKRRRLTSRQAARAGEADPVLGILLGEVQRLFGRVLNETEIACVATLYVQDAFPAELVMMAAAQAVKNKADNARYIEKILEDWRRQGVQNGADADRYLLLCAEREERQEQLAQRMGLAGDVFTLAEKKKIILWFEEYGYGFEMIEAARLSAGEKQNDVKYLAGILKKWHSKGYTSPKDVAMGDENHNLRVTRGRGNLPQRGQDVIGAADEYVPLRQRSGR